MKFIRFHIIASKLVYRHSFLQAFSVIEYILLPEWEVSAHSGSFRLPVQVIVNKTSQTRMLIGLTIRHIHTPRVHNNK